MSVQAEQKIRNIIISLSKVIESNTLAPPGAPATCKRKRRLRLTAARGAVKYNVSRPRAPRSTQTLARTLQKRRAQGGAPADPSPQGNPHDAFRPWEAQKEVWASFGCSRGVRGVFEGCSGKPGRRPSGTPGTLKPSPATRCPQDAVGYAALTFLRLLIAVLPVLYFYYYVNVRVPAAHGVVNSVRASRAENTKYNHFAVQSHRI